MSKYTDPAWIKTRAENRLLGTYYRNFVANDGISIMEEDWDTLVILDACRFDTLAEVAPQHWPEVTKATSKAANTWNFYRRNFDSGPYADTVVVTAQPRTVQLRGDAFHDVVSVFDDDWDAELGTVTPDVMAERTIAAHQTYPNKRILSHWVQPHYPFIRSDRVSGYKADGESIWKDLHRGNLTASDEDVYEAYEKTLKTTLPEVDRVIDAVDGLGVISSDHGNVFGKRIVGYPFKIYGHPRDVRIPELVDVPWVEFSGDRREITSETPESRTSDDDDVVQDRLENLGYKT